MKIHFRFALYIPQSELRRLKSETVRLKDEQQKLAQGEDCTPSPLKELARGNFFPEQQRNKGQREGKGGGEGGEGTDEGAWEPAVLKSAVEWGEGEGGEGGKGGGGEGAVVRVDEWQEFHDFGDVITSQSEINRLQSELSHSQLQCQHWRRLAQDKVQIITISVYLQLSRYNLLINPRHTCAQ